MTFILNYVMREQQYIFVGPVHCIVSTRCSFPIGEFLNRRLSSTAVFNSPFLLSLLDDTVATRGCRKRKGLFHASYYTFPQSISGKWNIAWDLIPFSLKRWIYFPNKPNGKRLKIWWKFIFFPWPFLNFGQDEKQKKESFQLSATYRFKNLF